MTRIREASRREEKQESEIQRARGEAHMKRQRAGQEAKHRGCACDEESTDNVVLIMRYASILEAHKQIGNPFRPRMTAGSLNGTEWPWAEIDLED